ncbi:hypothetical protein PoB_001210400 [Plakobranchus ocellatus]|uniref:Uncharacterized protein n=1 Tax=Plakobranchus ocellatus TaxID=259542 RepID=A0AAV3YUJ9_9GAST|nr:hypothetical protein PoB_001210400 [Plakobranchus ocellatus]
MREPPLKNARYPDFKLSYFPDFPQRLPRFFSSYLLSQHLLSSSVLTLQIISSLQCSSQLASNCYHVSKFVSLPTGFCLMKRNILLINVLLWRKFHQAIGGRKPLEEEPAMNDELMSENRKGRGTRRTKGVSSAMVLR